MRARGQQEREAMRQMTHQSILERYKKLIPIIKFRKNDK